jgi:hypothetical protein
LQSKERKGVLEQNEHRKFRKKIVFNSLMSLKVQENISKIISSFQIKERNLLLKHNKNPLKLGSPKQQRRNLGTTKIEIQNKNLLPKSGENLFKFGCWKWK